MFRFTVSCGLSRGVGFWPGWPFKRGSRVYSYTYALSMNVEHHTGASCGCAIHECGAPHRGKLWMYYSWMWSTTQGKLWMCYSWMWSTTQGQAVDVLFMNVEHHTGQAVDVLFMDVEHHTGQAVDVLFMDVEHHTGQAVDVLSMDVEHHTGASCGCAIHGCGAPHRNLNKSFQCLDYNPTKNSLHRPSALHKQTRMWREMFSKVVSYIT